MKLFKTCFWGHKWSKWSAPYYIAYFKGGFSHSQKRTCERCNKIQEDILP